MLIMVMLVGCSTTPRHSGDSRTANWTEVENTNAPLPELEHVPEGPQLAAPAASLPEPFKPHVIPSEDVLNPIARWSRENKFGTVRETSVSPVPAFSLSTPQGVLTFQANSLLARWNGLEFRLGFEPQMIGGQPFFHTLDLEKNLKPLFRPFEIPSRTNRVIVLDPGHGGKNAGTESVLLNANEKEFTLDWARRLGRLLATNGWQVFLTRTNDSDVALS